MLKNIFSSNLHRFWIVNSWFQTWILIETIKTYANVQSADLILLRLFRKSLFSFLTSFFLVILRIDWRSGTTNFFDWYIMNELKSIESESDIIIWRLKAKLYLRFALSSLSVIVLNDLAMRVHNIQSFCLRGDRLLRAFGSWGRIDQRRGRGVFCLGLELLCGGVIERREIDASSHYEPLTVALCRAATKPNQKE